MKGWKFFPCRKVGNIIGIANFSEFHFQNWNYCEFWEVESTFHYCSAQCLESSNFDHSRITLPHTFSYFVAHYYGTCVITSLIPTFKRTKKTHFKLWLETSSSLGWNYCTPTSWVLGVVDNWCLSWICILHSDDSTNVVKLAIFKDIKIYP